MKDGERKMVCVCVKVVCETERVTKLCVKDGVCVCVKVGYERERVTKLCERWCVTKGCVKDGA